VLSIVASFLVSTVIAGVAFFILQGLKIELERSRVYDEVMTKANALNVLLAALKEGSNPSDLPQILNVHASLSELLKKISSTDALEESLIRQIKRDNEKLGFLLDQISVSGTGGRTAPLARANRLLGEGVEPGLAPGHLWSLPKILPINGF
jgi:hypothetical protein